MPGPTHSIDPVGGLESELYRVLANSAPDAIIAIDENSIILSANVAVERLFGYTADEIIGQSLALLMPDRMRGAHYAGIARYTHTGARHIPWQSIRVPILTKSGTEIPVEVSFGEFVADGRRIFSGFLRDVSDRVAAEHALHLARREAENRAIDAEQLANQLQEQAIVLEQQAEEAQALGTDAQRAAALSRRLQAVTAAFARVLSIAEVAEMTLSQGLDALSAQAGVVYRVNRADAVLEVAGMKGIPADAMTQWDRIALDASSPASDAVRSRETLYFGHRFAAVERYPSLANARKLVESDAWVVVPLFHGADPLGAVALGFAGARQFSEDDRVLIEALGRQCAQAMERARLLDAERAAREEAESANRTRSEFLATMSHELRTPLNAIAGYVELIEMGLRGAVTEAQREDLGRIRRSQQRLLSLVNDVLSFARIDAGQVRYELADLSLDAVLSEVEMLVLPQLRAKGIAYQLNSPACDLTVHSDGKRLEQILINLLSNAVKFTPAGGTVTITCEADSSHVRLFVTDTGIGIPRAKLHSIFEPFVQVESGHTRTAEGTGLGLAISRELAAGMGASVTVSSEVGAGSTFTVTVPRFPGTSQSGDLSAVESEGKQDPAGSA